MDEMSDVSLLFKTGAGTCSFERSTILTRPFSLNLGKNPWGSLAGSGATSLNLNSTSSVCLLPNSCNLSASADLREVYGGDGGDCGFVRLRRVQCDEFHFAKF